MPAVRKKKQKMLKPPSDLYEEPDDELMGELLLGVGAANGPTMVVKGEWKH